MKIFESIYIIIIGISITDWLATSNSIIAWGLGILTLIYMGYKIYDLHLTVKKKRKDG